MNAMCSVLASVLLRFILFFFLNLGVGVSEILRGEVSIGAPNYSTVI